MRLINHYNDDKYGPLIFIDYHYHLYKGAAIDMMMVIIPNQSCSKLQIPLSWSMIILMTMMMVWPLVLIADPYQIHDDVTTANDHYNDGGMGIDSDI